MQSISWNHIARRLVVTVVSAIGAALVASCGEDSVTEPPDPAANSRPVADAGPDLARIARENVTLDASASYDPDGDPLTYRWELLTQPAGSGATLSDPTAMRPSVVVGVHGDFMVALVVSDGTLESTPDTVAIDVAPLAGISLPSDTVGAGLQLEASATLGLAAHGGVTVRIASGDSLGALIAPDLDTPGTSFIDVEVATGFDAVPYVVQGVAGAVGPVTVTASVPGFSDGTGTLAVVEPAVSIRDLHDAQIIGSNTVFSVVIGLPDTTGTKVSEPQGTSAANLPPLVLTVTSSNGTAGRVMGTGSAADTIGIELASGISEHQVTFEPLAAGATAVTASVPGFVTLASGLVDVTVDRRSITPFSHVIGAGLQFGDTARLDVADHGGVTVRIESSDTTVALIARDVTAPGSAYLDVVVADGDDVAPYVVQGVAGATGMASVTASATGFTTGSGTITVAQPAVAIHELAPGQAAGGEDAFVVAFGIPNAAGSALVETQAISGATTNPVIVTVTSSDGGVGEVSAGSSAGATITVDISAGMDRAELMFSSLSGGTTTVSVSIPGFLSPASASLDITVDAAVITLLSATIGAGLQYGDAAQLDVNGHGGVTVRFESSDSTVALIAPDVNTPGSPFIDVEVAAGDNVAPYVVQGVAGATGTVTVTASAPGFVDGVGTIEVVQPAVSIFGLPSAASVGTDDVFTVFIGLPNAAGTDLRTYQGMSAANVPPLVLTMTSSDGTVSHLSAGGTSGETITLDMTAGMFQRNVTLQPLAPGTTTISASMPGFMSTTSASVDIAVSAANITPFSRSIGAGLQYGYGAQFDTADHQGVTVRIESSDSTVALIAPDVNTPGSPFIDVDVAAGDTFAPYVVQGVAGATGRISVTASAPGFATGAGTIDVVQPAVTMAALSGSRSVGLDDVFVVFIGVPNLTGTAMSGFQGASAANVPPLELTVTSGDAAVGHVSVGGTSGETVTLDMTAGMFQPNVTFQPLAPGTTTVSASIPGFMPLPEASVDVSVEPATITVFPDTVGAGLQVTETVRLGTANHRGVTVRIESGDPTLALIAPDVNTPGTAFLDVVVADGEDDVTYVLQGVAGAVGSVTVTASAAPLFSPGVDTFEVVEPAVSISGLSSTVVLPRDDPFQVDWGVPDAQGLTLATLQAVSAANATPLVLTLTSSDGNVGHVTDGLSSGPTITVDLTVDMDGTAATFRSFALGLTTVTASIPGFLSTTAATVDVTVSSQ